MEIMKNEVNLIGRVIEKILFSFVEKSQQLQNINKEQETIKINFMNYNK